MRATNAVRGAVTTEYAIVLGAVAIVLAAAIVATYPRLVHEYVFVTSVVGGSAP